MNEDTNPRLSWTELGVERPGWVVTGSFQVGGANYKGTFFDDDELSRFLDFVFAAPRKPATSRLYLHPNVSPLKPEHQLSNLRFQFDAERGVAAAVLLVAVGDEFLVWRTSCVADGRGAVLAHDSWNEHETRLPPESFVDLPTLREAVVQWGFGDTVPPPAVSWSDARDERIDWF